ncbi:MAG: hypothetical protein ACRDJH_02470 [Thermomicrobiales bacterium]
MTPPITTCETALLERSLRVARAQRGWQKEVAARADRRSVTPAAVERREPRPDRLGVVLAKLLNGGVIAVIAAIVAWAPRLTQARDASWDGLRSKEHELDAYGVTWATDPADDERLAEELRRASQRRAAMPIPTAHLAAQPSIMVQVADERVFRAPLATDRYPILSAIDRARDDGRPGFAEDADAARLEQLARVMTEQFWSDMAWVTGYVPERAFCFVCQALERERTAITLVVADPAAVGSAAA